MTQGIARFFRSANANLITCDNFIVEKFFKLTFALSVWVYRMAGKKPRAGSAIVIENFDHDIAMKIDPSRSMGAAIYWTGYHEFREFLFLHRYLKKDMVFVDIGANQGEYALFAAKRLTEGNVLAFEPLPSIRKVLAGNIAMNGFRNIQVFDFGLSDQEGSLQIHEIDDAHEGLATFYPANRKSKTSFSVNLRTLDAVFPSTGLRRLELKALQGSIGTLEAYRPSVLIEINEVTYTAAGYTIQDVQAFFRERRYEAYEIRKRGQLVKCGRLPSFGNIIFRPQ
jgi:FkbM family methyltransferase